MDRRDFLRQCANFAPGAALLVYGVRANIRATGRPVEGEEDAERSYDWEQHFYGMVVNLSKCIGCCTCMRACRDENFLGDRGFRTWVERYTIYEDNTVSIDVPAFRENKGKELRNPTHQLEYPQIGAEKAVRERFFVPKLCNHCAKPPCVQVCPVGATFQTRDGVVVIDHASCVGCAYCIQACPYGARFWDEAKLCANKCSFCYHRITKGLPTACVQSCPTGARVFGDFKDPDSPIYDAIHKEKASILKRMLGTEPKVYYTDIHEEIV